MPTDETRTRLLEAAGRRFVAVGVTKTTMAELAAEAGVTKPTLYKRFPDKQAVVDALVERETDAFAARVLAAAADDLPAADQLCAAFATAVRWLERHPFLRTSLALEPAMLLPILTESGGRLHEAGLTVFRTVVTRGVASGELRSPNPRLTAEVCWRLVLSYVLLPAAGNRRRGGTAKSDSALESLVRSTLIEGLQP